MQEQNIFVHQKKNEVFGLRVWVDAVAYTVLNITLKKLPKFVHMRFLINNFLVFVLPFFIVVLIEKCSKNSSCVIAFWKLLVLV